MTDQETAQNPAWVPSACTLPSASRPLRVAEFDEFFARSVRALERPDPTRLRLTLDPDPATAARAAELAARENGCCSFFAFTLGIAEDGTVLQAEVPAERTAVLDALQAVRAALAEAVAAGCDDLVACAEQPCCPLSLPADGRS